jgi:hypothetical protein
MIAGSLATKKMRGEGGKEESEKEGKGEEREVLFRSEKNKNR